MRVAAKTKERAFRAAKRTGARGIRTREAADLLNVSTVTSRLALEELVREKRLERRRGIWEDRLGIIYRGIFYSVAQEAAK